MPLTTRYGFADTATPWDPSLAWTALSASALAGATTVTVDDASMFPSAVEFDIIVGVRQADGTLASANCERAHVLSVSGLTLMLAAPLASAHADEESVYHDLSAEGVKNNPQALTDPGDISYLNAAGRMARLAAGADGTVLRYAGGLPTAGAILAGDLPGHSAALLTSGSVPLARLSGLTVTQFSSAAVSQWTNDSGYLTAAAAAATYQPIGSYATLTGLETLTNKTLTTPTIASFTNATHTHLNAAGGGVLSAAAVSAAGSDTQVQFNDGGVFAGDPGLTYNKTTNALSVSGPVYQGSPLTGALVTWLGASVNSSVIVTAEYSPSDEKQANVLTYTIGNADPGLNSHVVGGISGYVSGGALGAETAALAGMQPTQMVGYGFNGTEFDYACGLFMEMAEDWTETNGGMHMRMSANKLGESGLNGSAWLEFSAATGVSVGRADMATTVRGTSITLGSHLVTLAGAFTTSGANALTLTTTGATNVTLPTSGTLATTTAPTFTAPVIINGAVGSSALTITGTTQTASFPVITATQTWNNAGVVFDAFKINVTATAAGNGSRLLLLQKGGVDIMSVTCVGSASLVFGNTSLSGSVGVVQSGGTTLAQLNAGGSGYGGLHMASAGGVSWGSGAGLDGSLTVALYRDGTGMLAQRVTTAAQKFRVYNTFTTVETAGEWFAIDWQTTANVCNLQAVKGSSSGTARVLKISYGGAQASPVAAISIPITSGDITFGGSVFPTGYKSSDGSAGVSVGPYTVITSITVKNGLVTALVGS